MKHPYFGSHLNVCLLHKIYAGIHTDIVEAQQGITFVSVQSLKVNKV